MACQGRPRPLASEQTHALADQADSLLGQDKIKIQSGAAGGPV